MFINSSSNFASKDICVQTHNQAIINRKKRRNKQALQKVSLLQNPKSQAITQPVLSISVGKRLRTPEVDLL